MIFEKLADFIVRHAKLVVVVWIVVLLASVYPAVNSLDKLSYDTTSMGGTDSESIIGMEIADEHFASVVDQENVQMLLVTYDKGSAQQHASASAAVDFVKDRLLNDYGKIANAMVSDPGAGNGLITMAIIYGEQFTSKDISSDTGNLRSYINTQMNASGQDLTGTDKYVTGTPAISYDAETAMAADMSLVDPISIFLILILVGLFFRSFVTSAAPPMTIGVAFALVMCAMFFLAQVLEIYYIVQMLLLVSMLGAGCDYCIFILSRYREERRSGLDHIPAAKQAITWAGESVFTSGLAVMIGFGSMVICDFNLVSTMGLGLAIGIVFALLAALTLMSSLVVLLGDRLFWPSGTVGEKTKSGYLKKFGDLAHSYFTKSTRFSIKHAKAIILATILFTAPMAYVYATSETSYDMIGAMMSGESQEGMNVMSEYGDAGAVMPNYVIVETSEPLGYVNYIGGAETGMGLLTFADSAYLAKIQDADREIAKHSMDADDNIASVEGINFVMNWDVLCAICGFPAGMPFEDALNALKNVPGMEMIADNMLAMLTPEIKVGIKMALEAEGTHMEWVAGDPSVAAIMNWVLFVQTGELGTTVSEDGNSAVCNYYKITMVTKEQGVSDRSIDTVSAFTDYVHGYADSTDVYKTVWVTGTAAVMVEISNDMSSQFLRIEIIAVALILLLLFVVLKSYLSPVRSVVTILMSVIWTVAITHLLFTNILGEGVIWMLPIMLLVICLGLGMDYDILLTTRIREYRFSKGMTNDEAISQAVLHSGSVITICGFIMAGTFGTMMLSSTVMLKEMGFALAFAILVDALVVRTYIVPAAMHLMGEWNWKGPAILDRPIKPGKGFAGSQGLLAAAVMIVFLIAAYAVSGCEFDVATLGMIMDSCKDCNAFVQIAFGIGGLLLLLFGVSSLFSSERVSAKLSGLMYAVSAVLMMVSSFGTFGECVLENLWTVALGMSVAASLVYAYLLARNGRSVAAGAIAAVAVPFAVAAVAGSMEASFALAIAVPVGVLVASIAKIAKLE